MPPGKYLKAICFIFAQLLLTWRSAGSRHPELLLPMSSRPPCQSRNLRLSDFIHSTSLETGRNLLPHKAQTLDEFVKEVKDALDSNMLQQRPIEYIFSDMSSFNPTCSGIWIEFGVAGGITTNLTARFKSSHCSQSCTPLYGFDTFTGLPEKWIRDDQTAWPMHQFDQKGLPKVEDNVLLVQGLFNESLPKFLAKQAMYGYTDEVISYIHIDCDLYTGARSGFPTGDALMILAPKLVVGTVVIFDDLINYQYFRDHEIKAMWEWLSATGTRLLPVGIKGPLPGKDYAVELNWEDTGAAHHHQQSAAFVIAQQNSPALATKPVPASGSEL